MKYENRVYNFSAGPSILPLEVIKEAADNLASYHGCGQSVMEMSHRSSEFKKIIEDAEADLRELMSIPDNYKVLFLQGGGTLQFSMVPLNLLRKSGKADYIVTGVKREDFRADADYVYVCYNNTIYGTHFPYIPDTGDIPLVADMSSCILSEEIDVSKFGLIFAGAQKNIAPAGVTIVIIREDLIGFAKPETPVYLDYKTHADNDSMYNTPPCFAIHIAGEVFKYLKKMGGVPAMHEVDVRKAGKLYAYIDGSGFYKSPVREKDRSLMNVVFVTGDADMDKKFVAAAKEQGLVNLNGHRSIGGMRASIYNAMPEEGVDKLIEFMDEFRKANQ